MPNQCIGNMLDISESLHVARDFLNQSDCRTFENSMLIKQAILNIYLDINMWLDILRANELNKSFYLVMVRCNLCLNQIYSEILEIPLTQEKF